MIVQIREYHKEFTMSDIYVDGKHFCYALEDVGRPNNVKIFGQTCIPEGTYKVSMTFSERFQREMTLLHNVSNFISKNGGTYRGIREHGGNSTAHTEG